MTEKVIETLTDAVRERIRAALAGKELDPGPAPPNGAEGNGVHDQGEPGKDDPARPPTPDPDEPRV
jgi:hypothetical protein